MCLALLALDVLPAVPLLLIGNRDEFHARTSASAAPWREDTRVLGGRDLEAGGSWLAARSDGRFALVTNHRVWPPARMPRSRGALVRDFVLGGASAAQAAEHACRHAAGYAPFHVLFGDGREVWRVDSTPLRAWRLRPGLHTLSNGAAGALWPKQRRLLALFEQITAAGEIEDDAALLALLADRAQPPDAQLPDTGVGLARERLLAPVFIAGEDYGTRASTVLRMRADGTAHLRERNFGPAGVGADESAWHTAGADSAWMQ